MMNRETGHIYQSRGLNMAVAKAKTRQDLFDWLNLINDKADCGYQLIRKLSLKEMIKVLILDDDLKLSMTDRTNLDSGIKVVGHFVSLLDYEQGVHRIVPDVLFLKLVNDKTSLLATINALKKIHPTTLLLLGLDGYDESFVLQAISAGVSGFILNEHLPALLAATIKELYQQGFVVGNLDAGKLIALIHQKEFQTDSRLKHPLTPREKQIISRLVKGQSYKMIALELDITYETVRSHIKNIYAKTNISSLTELVATALNDRLI